MIAFAHLWWPKFYLLLLWVPVSFLLGIIVSFRIWKPGLFYATCSSILLLSLLWIIEPAMDDAGYVYLYILLIVDLLFGIWIMRETL